MMGTPVFAQPTPKAPMVTKTVTAPFETPKPLLQATPFDALGYLEDFLHGASDAICTGVGWMNLRISKL